MQKLTQDIFQRWHLAKDKVTVVRYDPQAESEIARQQGYVMARTEVARVNGAPSPDALLVARALVEVPAMLQAMRDFLLWYETANLPEAQIVGLASRAGNFRAIIKKVNGDE